MPGWPAELAWRQKVAAFWSISWPAWLGSILIVGLVTSPFPVDRLETNIPKIALVGHITFFTIQMLLTRRLVRKKYRTFRIRAVRDGGDADGGLSWREAGTVWLYIFAPQIIVELALSFFLLVGGGRVPPETSGGVSSLALWLEFVLVGPYAVDLALRRKYPGFSFQTYALRHI